MLRYETPENIVAFSTNRDGKAPVVGFEHFVLPHQTHDTVTRIIDSDFLEHNPVERSIMLDGVDALCTDLPKVCLCVKTADCIPVFVYDKRNSAVAAIHAGWRGTVARIVEKTLGVMAETYGTKGCDCSAIIGPGISLDSFEVGDEVYEEFFKAGFPMGQIAKRYPASVGTKWHIDLWEANRLQLLGCGFAASSIEVAGICTVKNSEEFYSARALGVKAGRIYNGIFRIPNQY